MAEHPYVIHSHYETLLCPHLEASFATVQVIVDDDHGLTFRCRECYIEVQAHTIEFGRLSLYKPEFVKEGSEISPQKCSECQREFWPWDPRIHAGVGGMVCKDCAKTYFQRVEGE